MNGKYKYLFKNIGLLTLSNFATKILSFFLVPLYTSILTTTEYGIYDFFNTTISLLIPILTFNILDGVLRYTLDKNYDKCAIVTISARFFIGSSFFVIVLVLLNGICGFENVFSEFGVYFVLMFLFQALSGVVIGYTRGIEKIADISISSVITSAIVIGCNLLFLLEFDWGIKGYFLANIIGPAFQCFYLITKNSLFKKIKFNNKYKKEKKDLLKYSRPLMANTISWWVNNAADKYVIIWFCGMSENGIYSVAAKIPTILNVFQNIFSQAWTLSAVKDYSPNDETGFFKNMYTSYNCIMTLLCSVIIVLDKILAKILYANEFFEAWIFVPWLTIAIVFGSMSGYIGGIFAAVKEPKVFAKSSVIGAAVNVILNFILTPWIGIIGAAISTTISYFIIWLIRIANVKKYISLRISLGRDLLSYVLLVVQAAVLNIVEHMLVLYLLQTCIFLIMFFLYKKDLGLVIKKILRRS